MRNLFILDKKAQQFETLQADEKGIAVLGHKISVDEVHTCLYCESLRNITIVVNGEKIYNATFVLDNEKLFQDTLELLKKVWKNVEFSEQNKKINGYAKALIEKLEAGIELTIIDSSDEEKVIVCPECGMQCDPSIPYCMECGASV